MTEARTRGYWARQFIPPEVVLQANKLEFGSAKQKPPQTPYRMDAAEFAEASEAQRLFDRALLSAALLYLCGPFSLFLAVPICRRAVAELTAIAERRRPPTLRRKALYAYWITKGVIWMLWLFLAVYLAMGALVGLGFATGVFK